MIYGVGIDIIEITRFVEALEKDSSFTDTVFSSDELSTLQKNNPPEKGYAAGFAVKEAVMKALGCGLNEGFIWKDIKVQQKNGRQYSATLRGKAGQFIEDKEIKKIDLSVSHTDTTATAIAILRK